MLPNFSDLLSQLKITVALMEVTFVFLKLVVVVVGRVWLCVWSLRKALFEALLKFFIKCRHLKLFDPAKTDPITNTISEEEEEEVYEGRKQKC